LRGFFKEFFMNEEEKRQNEAPTLERAIRILEEAGYRVFDITQRVNPGIELSASEALEKGYLASFSITPGKVPATTKALPGTVIDRL
jgi:hypothetical protein